MGDERDAQGDLGDQGMSITEQLAAADEHYQGVGEGPDGPPPGLYKFQLASVEFKLRSSDSKLLLMWTHVVLEGEHKGEQLTDFSQPTSQKAFPIRLMRQRINRMGWTAPDNLPDLEEIVPQIDAAGPIYTGRVKHSGGFANLEVENLIEQYGARSGQRPARQASGDASAAAEAALKKRDQVSFTDQGKEYLGEVVAVTPNDVHVRVEGEKELFAAEPNQLTLVKAASAAGGDGNVGDPAGGVSALDELIALAVSAGYDVPQGIEQDSLVETLREDAKEKPCWFADKLTPDEVALLTGVGVPVEAAAKPPEAKPKAKKKAKKKAKRRA